MRSAERALQPFRDLLRTQHQLFKFNIKGVWEESWGFQVPRSLPSCPPFCGPRAPDLNLSPFARTLALFCTQVYAALRENFPMEHDALQGILRIAQLHANEHTGSGVVS